MLADERYEIRKAREDEKLTVVSFLEQNYFPRECVNRLYLKKNEHRIDANEKKLIEDDIKNTYTIIVDHVPCLVAVHRESKKIVGLTLMLVEENPYFDKTTNTEDKFDVEISPVTEMPVPFKSKIIDEIATYVAIPGYNSVDLFAKFPSQQTALRLTFLCVDPEHCGHGLATRLVQEIINYAERKGIGFIYGLCTSPFSIKATEKNGFKKFSEMDILNCRDNEGNAIFQDEESHTIRMMAKEVRAISSN